MYSQQDAELFDHNLVTNCLPS